MARNTADLDALVGRTLGRRRYEVVARIAQGGMAIVYRGHDRQLDRVVAIKVPRPEFARDREFSEQFRREARTAARLSHPNVVAVYDSGEERGLPWIVMEHISGRTLRDLLDSQRRLSPETTAELLGPVADALDHAHHAGVVHLDVKPENLLLTSETVKVADFGLVRAAAQRGHGQALAATVHYCAPEVLRGGVVDGRADVYALGVVAWECVSGRPPFEGDARQVVQQHLGGRVPPPSRVAGEVAEPFDVAVLRATDPDPTRRYLRASDFAAAIGAPAAGGSTRPSVPPPSCPPVADTTAAWAAAAEPSCGRGRGHRGRVPARLRRPRVPPPWPGRRPPGGRPSTAGRGPRRGALTGGRRWRAGRPAAAGRPVAAAATPDHRAGAQDAGRAAARAGRGGCWPCCWSSACSAAGLLTRAGGLLGGSVRVPEVVGLEVAEATRDLQGRGLKVRVGEAVASDHVHEGLVATQSVAGGERARRQDTVALQPSLGITLPDLTRRPAGAATGRLEDLEIQFRTQSGTSLTVPKGSVIADPPSRRHGAQGRPGRHPWWSAPASRRSRSPTSPGGGPPPPRTSSSRPTFGCGASGSSTTTSPTAARSAPTPAPGRPSPGGRRSSCGSARAPTWSRCPRSSACPSARPSSAWPPPACGPATSCRSAAGSSSRARAPASRPSAAARSASCSTCSSDVRIGAHVSVAGGLAKAVGNASDAGCESLQVFVSNARGWAPPPVDPAGDERFRADLDEAGLGPLFVHAPYLVNFASATPLTRERSREVVAATLAKAASIGAAGVVVHAGQALASGRAAGLATTRETLLPLADTIAGLDAPDLVLELTAGPGEPWRHRFEEMAELLAACDHHPRLKVCMDTCHAQAAGYDLTDPIGVTKTLDELFATLGDRVVLVHANDSRDPVGAGRDRHCPIGTGTIGDQGFTAILAHPALATLPIITETTGDPAQMATDLARLHNLRPPPRR